MAKLVSLHNSVHQDLRISPEKAEFHGAELNMVPVMLSEFLKLAVQFPIALTKSKETGKFSCVAMLGFAEKENLFWQHSKLDTLYTPLHIFRQPFFLGRNETENHSAANSDEQYVVCFDAESNSIVSEGGELLFTSTGEETPYLRKMKAVLAELLDGEAPTQTFVETLLELDLLTSMQLDITFANGESQRVNGMYTIDEKKLNALAGDTVVKLHGAGYLAYIYAMVTSTGQIYSLIQKKNARLSAAALNV